MTVTEITAELTKLNHQHEALIIRLVKGIVDANLTSLEKTYLLDTLMERFLFLFTESTETVIKTSKFDITFFATPLKEIVLRDTGFWVSFAGTKEKVS